MRVTLISLVVGFFAATACSTPQPTASAGAGSADEALRSELKQYVVAFLRRNPTTNTYLGGAGFDAALQEVDGLLRDYSPSALEEEARWLTESFEKIERLDPTTLSSAARIDREVALAQIRFMRRQQSERRYQERALDTYVSEPFRAIDWQLQGMTQTGTSTYGTAAEWDLVARRVAGVAGYLATAEQQIREGVKNGRVPDRRMLERDGIGTAEANAKYFATTLPALAEARVAPAQRASTVERLHAAGEQASHAYLKMRDFVLATFFAPGRNRQLKPEFAADRFAMGEAEYNWALENNFRLQANAATLYHEAWPIVEDTTQRMVALAREIGTAKGLKLPPNGPAAVRAIFDELSKDYPKSDGEMVSWYRDAAFRLVDYARKTGIFDVPADYKLDVVETPPPLQASVDGAAYYPAPPFKTSGVGRFYVTPTHDNVAALRTNNRASLAYLAAHEGFPGHDWYYKVLTEGRSNVSPVRWLTPGAVEDSSAMWEDSMPAEGWGLYAEALMAEPQPGASAGFYTPEERLYQLHGQLYRDLRVRIDTGIHTGRMTYDEAVTLFSEVVDFFPGPCGGRELASAGAAKQESCAAAERAIFRYSKWPTQAITYRLGKDQIYALRAEASRLLGASFSPKTFHLLFIRQGTIPANYFRQALLDQLQSGR